jgi:uncharacterized protein YjbI with pentapeptide repeats
MFEAKLAPVRPRGLPLQNLQNGTTVLLEEELLSFVEAGPRGIIAILGPVGSGKTTALRHLAATLPSFGDVALQDEPPSGEFVDQLAKALDGLVIYTTRSESLADRFEHLAMYRLSPWTQDDLIEYLLTVHRERIASVMARVCAADHLMLGGLPELWRIALDRLACDDSLPDVRHALHRHLQEHLTDTDLLERARSACLNVLITPSLSLADGVTTIAKPGFARSLIRALHHPPIQRMLAAERVAADLNGEGACDYLAKPLPRDLVEATGRLITEDKRALERLHILVAGPAWSHSMAVSLLNAAGASASLRSTSLSWLAGAYLSKVYWPEIRLTQADLREADLTGADLRRANLARANANKTCFCNARLNGACLSGIMAAEADFRCSDLSHVIAETASFVDANLEQANFTQAQLPEARFEESNLTAAVLRDAVLLHADFTGSIIERAVFSGADLTRSILSGLCLREAHWQGARFTEADMEECDLEYMTLPCADFELAHLRRALLTGSTMFGANFRGACLREAGLADIEWENADLRGADLRGASFHMGSTRSGLVGSTIPCEGSKTGFYTDDYDEQTYKTPEDIRKANLCGADLRGAILDGVDFYLVDLRGAQYDEKYADHLRRCGAILEARV